MSREILFRAKFEGKWVYGYLFDVGNDAVVIHCPKDKMYYSCDAETVGQYTGFRDADGNKMYEGDIVKVWDRGVCAIKEIRWRQEGCPMYILYPACGSEWFLHGVLIGTEYRDNGCKVIGNIHDNPEMVEG